MLRIIILSALCAAAGHAAIPSSEDRVRELLAHWNPHHPEASPASVRAAEVPKVLVVPVAKPRGFIQRIRDGIEAATTDRSCIYSSTIFPDLYATTDRGGGVSAPGPRGNYKTKATDAYVALPSFDLRGREVFVRCRCARHKDGPFHPFKVWDTGPWSRFDNFVDNGKRPAAEGGESDTYRHVPVTGPGIDISIGAWPVLGHQIGTGPRADNYSGRVDVLVVTKRVERASEFAEVQ